MLSNNSTLYDMMNQMGLQRRYDPYENVLPALAVFSAGVLSGAAVAMLVAPKPGRELRGDIVDGAGHLKNRVQRALPGVPNPEPTHSPAYSNSDEAIAK